MFVKLVNGQIEEAPVLLQDNEKTYSNPSEETLRAFGYKEYIIQEIPEDDNKCYRCEYVETDTTITKIWIEYQPEVVEEEESEPQE